ncbi:Atic [Symbiodinium microadriaticum]|nr:Atic [Symbiodinium microadriaticum]
MLVMPGAAVGLPLSSVEAQAYERPFDTSNGQVNTGLSAVACAYVRARNADPMCSFGDFVAISDIVDECTAKVLKTEVCDGIIAPGYDEAALSILRAKKKGAFIILQGNVEFQPPRNEFREVMGVGFYQRRNDALFSADLHLQRVVTAGREMLPASALRDLTVASIAVKYTQSNSVGYAVNGQMVGVGAGQQSRVDCVKLAARKVSTWFLRQHPKANGSLCRVRYIEGDIEGAEMTTWSQHFETVPPFLSVDEKNSFLRSLRGVSLSSDAFFPFRDSIDHATKVGVEFVAQPGGSMADAEVIAACEEYGVQMAFTDLRLFHH